MKTIIAVLSIWTFSSSLAWSLEPIPGSITYGGGPRGQLTHSPVGSTVLHHFSDGGQDYNEVYVVGPDRALKLVTRTQANRD